MDTFGSTSTTTLNGITLSAGESPSPARVPKGLITTRAVQVKAGWIGQVSVAEEIVWETDFQETAKDAEEEATTYVVDRIKALLVPRPRESDPATTDA